MKLTQEQAVWLEQKHNVCIDVDVECCTTGERYDWMGWGAIPEEWYVEVINEFKI